MKTAFKTKNMKIESFGIFIMKISNFKSDLRTCIFKDTAHNNKELIKSGLSATVVIIYMHFV